MAATAFTVQNVMDLAADMLGTGEVVDATHGPRWVNVGLRKLRNLSQVFTSQQYINVQSGAFSALPAGTLEIYRVERIDTSGNLSLTRWGVDEPGWEKFGGQIRWAISGGNYNVWVRVNPPTVALPTDTVGVHDDFQDVLASYLAYRYRLANDEAKGPGDADAGAFLAEFEAQAAEVGEMLSSQPKRARTIRSWT